MKFISGLVSEWKTTTKSWDKFVYFVTVFSFLVLLYSVIIKLLGIREMLPDHNTFWIIYTIFFVLLVISTIVNHRRNKEIVRLEKDKNDVNDINTDNIKSIYEQKRQEVLALGDQIVFYKDRAANQEEKAVLFEKERNNFEKELVKTQNQLNKAIKELKDAREATQESYEKARKSNERYEIMKCAFEELNKEHQKITRDYWIDVEPTSYELKFGEVKQRTPLQAAGHVRAGHQLFEL